MDTTAWHLSRQFSTGALALLTGETRCELQRCSSGAMTTVIKSQENTRYADTVGTPPVFDFTQEVPHHLPSPLSRLPTCLDVQPLHPLHIRCAFSHALPFVEKSLFSISVFNFVFCFSFSFFIFRLSRFWSLSFLVCKTVSTCTLFF